MANISPLVSIIIPTYKNSTRLAKSVSSALNQTYRNIEVIVIDDNSEEYHQKKTEEILTKFKKFQNLKLIIHGRNRNGSAARNTGIKESRGTYIAFLDDDDMFDKRKIELQIKYLSENNFDGVYCAAKDQVKRKNSKREGNLSEQLLLLDIYIPTPSLVIQKKVIEDLKGFDEKYIRHQDYEFLLRFFDNGYTLGYVENTFVEIGNQGQNRIYGEKLLAIKERFFCDFNDSINLINRKKKGFKNKVLATHYTLVFISFLREKEWSSAKKVYKTYCSRNKYFFIKKLFEVTRRYIAINMQKKIKLW